MLALVAVRVGLSTLHPQRAEAAHRRCQVLNTANVEAIVLSAGVQMESLPAIQIVEDARGIPVTSTSVRAIRRMLAHLGLEGGRSQGASPT